MGYLVCDSCQGYYELRSGESPEDFLNECDCGGTLNFLESLEFGNESFEGDSDSETSLTENADVETSGEDYTDSHVETSNGDVSGEETSNMESFKTSGSSVSQKFSKLDTRIIRLIIGMLVVLIPNFSFSSSFNILFFALGGIPLILGGFISSVLTQKRRYTDGILNGARVGLFSGVIYLLISLIISLIYGTFTMDIAGIGLLLSFLVLMLLTSLGGLLGIGILKLMDKLEIWNENRPKKSGEALKTDEVMETETLNQAQIEDNKYRDDLVKLGYKQMSAINDGEKVFNCLLSDSISENDAIIRLKDDQKVVYEVLREMKKITPPERYRDYHKLKIESSTDICKTFEIIDGLVKNDPTKIKKTNNLVENSTNKINQAISELHRTMWEEDPVN